MRCSGYKRERVKDQNGHYDEPFYKREGGVYCPKCLKDYQRRTGRR
jgi:hypothetical protein